MKHLPLPTLEIPDQAVLLYENVALDPDRSGNWRFFFRQDGCFFHARNSALWITEPKDFNDPQPAFHWNTPFPKDPISCLSEAQYRDLETAIQQAHFESLSPLYQLAQEQTPSHESAERWTSIKDGTALTVVVINEAKPESLAQLHATIDQLLEANERE